MYRLPVNGNGAMSAIGCLNGYGYVTLLCKYCREGNLLCVIRNIECAVTVAGYLLEMTQSIPEPGQKFVFGGLLFEIVKRNKNQISLIKITPQTEENSSEDIN